MATTRVTLRPGQIRTAAANGQIVGLAGGALQPLPAGSTNVPSLSPDPTTGALPTGQAFGPGPGFATGFPVNYVAGEKIEFEGAQRLPQLNDSRAVISYVRVKTAGDVTRASLLVGPDGRLPDGQRTVVVENGKLIPLPEWSLVLLEG